MTKAALLSTCGDPFILMLCVKLWQERWYGEIDKLYINYNNHCGIPSEVVGECLSRLVEDPKIDLVYHPTGKGNGPPQVELLKIANEDLILLLEDDFFIVEAGVVSGYFKKIESDEVDLLGSPRYAVGEIAQAAKKKYNLDYSGFGDRGYGWWPTGFYCKREDLLKTDLNFGSKEYKEGEYYKELDHTMLKTEYTDTFTWASLQLRFLGLRCGEIPQYHAFPYDIEYSERGEEKFAQPIGYIHGGSLSAGWGGYLSGILPDVSTDSAKQEIESRVAFWKIACDYTVGFENFKISYYEGIGNLIEGCKLSSDRIDRKVNLYKKLMKL